MKSNLFTIGNQNILGYWRHAGAELYQVYRHQPSGICYKISNITTDPVFGGSGGNFAQKVDSYLSEVEQIQDCCNDLFFPQFGAASSTAQGYTAIQQTLENGQLDIGHICSLSWYKTYFFFTQFRN